MARAVVAYKEKDLQPDLGALSDFERELWRKLAPLYVIAVNDIGKAQVARAGLGICGSLSVIS